MRADMEDSRGTDEIIAVRFLEDSLLGEGGFVRELPIKTPPGGKERGHVRRVGQNPRSVRNPRGRRGRKKRVGAVQAGSGWPCEEARASGKVEANTRESKAGERGWRLPREFAWEVTLGRGREATPMPAEKVEPHLSPGLRQRCTIGESYREGRRALPCTMALGLGKGNLERRSGRLSRGEGRSFERRRRTRVGADPSWRRRPG
ncbi:hypothetical protein KM043_000205 [Ampulex compressa]|nr:hypothetical protein KM043_000205 [Ampulex compressa]